MLDLVSKRYLFFLISLIIIIPGVISLFLFGLKLGIDFTGGTYWEVVPRSADVSTNEVAQLLKDNGQSDVAVQNATLIVGNVTTPTLVMRMPNISPDQKDALTKVLVDHGIISGTEHLVSASSTTTATTTATVTATATTTGTTAPAAGTTTVTRIAPGDEIQFNTVGPTIGSEVASRAILSVLAASLGILAYLWYAFRRVPNAIRYGVCAVIALLHDVLVVVGIFSILGELFGIEIDALFITAMLTVIGFSVHDTIVVFDRIRENLLKTGGKFEDLVEKGVNESIARSINTSLTATLPLVAIWIWGGESLHHFAFTLVIGIAAGVYSSIFLAAPLLVAMQPKSNR
jgi:preprotein translocase subunit SecF